MTLCIISLHKKGFWTGDIYLEGYFEGASDRVISGMIGGTKAELYAVVLGIYPDAKFEDGVTGTCNECGEHHFKLELLCNECGGIVGEE